MVTQIKDFFSACGRKRFLPQRAPETQIFLPAANGGKPQIKGLLHRLKDYFFVPMAKKGCATDYFGSAQYTD